ncbi:MAG: ankyrin repeat domain-containing protein [Rickettsia endosymbiont of Glossina mortisans submortisans]|nr:ankyrin repeat domain-containing protein [Rickettsia endosymbiont of Glossina mortisans submortisans]
MPKKTENNINNERLLDGSTPLHNEVRAGNVKTIKLLITQGTDFNVTDDQGKTPLDYAPTEEIKQILIAAMRVNQTLTYSKADKYFKDLKNTYIKTEADKGKAIDILFSDDTIELEVQEVVIQRILNYDVTGNNEVAAPAIIASVAVTSAPVSVTTQVPTRGTQEAENRLSADVKKRLFNGEDAMQVISSLEYYSDISRTKIEELTNYICDYAFGTKLAGDIDLGL